MEQPIWTPSKERIESAVITDFCDFLTQEDFPEFTNYDDLWTWSVESPDNFWSAFWDFSNIKGTKGKRVLVNKEDIFNATFFPDAKINFAENLLRHKGIDPAIIFHSEVGERTEWSWDQLRETVSRLQQGLISNNVGAGDRVAGLVPNTPYTIAAALAVTSIGAIWCSCSPDFGFKAAMDRISQIEPKVLFCADGYTYNGKPFSSIPTAAQLSDAIPSIKRVIVFPLNSTSADITPIRDKGEHFAEFIKPFAPKKLTFNRLNFNDPVYIMFSSGTTGMPKCIVHSIGGALLQHIKEHTMQVDMRPADRLLYFTTCGWMMWNWMISGLASGVTLVLFDGSPFYPDGYRLANIVAAERVTHFGTSAKYLASCSKAAIIPKTTHDFEALRTVLSTGSPLSAEGYDYVYDAWKQDVCLSSIAGGTDILGCFVGGSPIDPVYRGECQKRHLAMDVQVYDGNANAISCEQGELVCASPHPSMPIGFWKDTDGLRYHAAYFKKFKNIWHQGDLVELTQNLGVKFYGRSDAVLNPGGVRIGTAEIYRVVEQLDEVIEGLVIGQNWDNDQRIVLFIRLKDGLRLDDQLVKKIKSEIRTNATPRHVPAIIIAISDIPRTKSGKIAELAVRDVVHGLEIKNQDSLANPEALELYNALPQLKL